MLKHDLNDDPDLRSGPTMTAPLKAIDGNADLTELMNALAARARAAARVLALASPAQKNKALEAIERAIRTHAAAILAANAEDVTEARARRGYLGLRRPVDADPKPHRRHGGRGRHRARHRGPDWAW